MKTNLETGELKEWENEGKYNFENEYQINLRVNGRREG